MKFCIKDIFAFVSISYNWQTIVIVLYFCSIVYVSISSFVSVRYGYELWLKKRVITRALFLKSPNNYRVGKAAVVAFKMEVSNFFYIT